MTEPACDTKTNANRDPRFDLRSQFTPRRIAINLVVLVAFYVWISRNPGYAIELLLYSPALLILAIGLWLTDQDTRLILATVLLVLLALVATPITSGRGPHPEPAAASWVAAIAAYLVHRFRF